MQSSTVLARAGRRRRSDSRIGMVSIAWLTRGNRKVRYRGVVKNDHWLHHRAAAINLCRLIIMGVEYTGTNWAIA